MGKLNIKPSEVYENPGGLCYLFKKVKNLTIKNIRLFNLEHMSAVVNLVYFAVWNNFCPWFKNIIGKTGVQIWVRDQSIIFTINNKSRDRNPIQFIESRFILHTIDTSDNTVAKRLEFLSLDHAGTFFDHPFPPII